MSDQRRVVDCLRWAEYYFVNDNDECVKPLRSAVFINAASNTTIVLERMVRKGRLAFYKAQRRPDGTI